MFLNKFICSFKNKKYKLNTKAASIVILETPIKKHKFICFLDPIATAASRDTVKILAVMHYRQMFLFLQFPNAVRNGKGQSRQCIFLKISSHYWLDKQNEVQRPADSRELVCPGCTLHSKAVHK